ncbi:hypothetical protein F0U44_02630 [Nocardioides humilatus]|uniref:Uncharacterized protein n=1 Tax=Nocardioides humilatus TaxID=2607660 RepID=A0A5B1LKF0_9ACTN|nr:hypothetical protein [Nocardioides humilatus]KAA1421225.1 hypothetical protein F0U44_02630 [Nocardioides humilatus]
MDKKELIKEIIGGPRWWLVCVPLMIVWTLVVAWIWPEDAHGAVPPPSSRICPSGDWSCYTADHYAKDFRAGRLRNSRGVDLPPRVERMIDAAMEARGRAAARGNDSWWRRALSATTCIAGPRWQGACRRGQEPVNELLAGTSRVALVCGGYAVIGFLRFGQGWGVGKAIGTCLWNRVMRWLT